jgi:hypothetical protein
MARDFVKNTSNLMVVGSGATAPYLSGASAVSFSCWVNVDAFSSAGTTNNKLFEFEIGGSNNGAQAALDALTSSPSRILRLGGRSNSTELQLQHSGGTTVTASTWVHLAGCFDIANDAIVSWVNGTETSSAAAFTNASYTPSGSYSDTDRIGANESSPSTATQLDGRMFNLGFWRARLSASSVDSLKRGIPPNLVQQSDLIFYWPLSGDQSPEPDLKSGLQGTISGTIAAADNPTSFNRCV